MKEFMLLFRRPEVNNVSPVEMEALAKQWQQWFGKLAAQGNIAQGPVQLNKEGKVLKPGGVVTDGPFVEVREMLGGFVVLKAADLDEAVTLAHGCPVLNIGGSVEIRTAVE
jgi:hypothetical protein